MFLEGLAASDPLQTLKGQSGKRQASERNAKTRTSAWWAKAQGGARASERRELRGERAIGKREKAIDDKRGRAMENYLGNYADWSNFVKGLYGVIGTCISALNAFQDLLGPDNNIYTNRGLQEFG